MLRSGVAEGPAGLRRLAASSGLIRAVLVSIDGNDCITERHKRESPRQKLPAKDFYMKTLLDFYVKL